MKHSIGLGMVALVVTLAACAAPTPEAMMKKESPTADAMMAKGTPTADAMMAKGTPTADAMMKIPDQMFAAHFVDSSPKHGEALAKLPEKIQINFNFTLNEISAITVTKDGAPVNVGKVMLGDQALAMSATLPMDAGDGLYLVKYKACWPDKSCHDGLFAFKVDGKIK